MKAEVNEIHNEKSTILRQNCDLVLLSQNALLVIIYAYNYSLPGTKVLCVLPQTINKLKSLYFWKLENLGASQCIE